MWLVYSELRAAARSDPQRRGLDRYSNVWDESQRRGRGKGSDVVKAWKMRILDSKHTTRVRAIVLSKNMRAPKIL